MATEDKNTGQERADEARRAAQERGAPAHGPGGNQQVPVDPNTDPNADPNTDPNADPNQETNEQA